MFSERFLFVVSHLYDGRLFRRHLVFKQRDRVCVRFTNVILHVRHAFNRVFFRHHANYLQVEVGGRRAFQGLSMIRSFQLRRIKSGDLVLSRDS